LALNESPHANTLLAGVLIIGTLAAHTAMSLWAMRRPADTLQAVS